MAFHARSNSLPSRSSPLTQDIENQFLRIRSSEAASSSSSSLVCQKLDSLKDLLESVDSWFQLPHPCLKQEGRCTEEVLEGSLRLLDLCGTTRDALSQMKSCVQELESCLRRRNYGAESSFLNGIEGYNRSKKMVNRMIRKCLGDLKKVQKPRMTLLREDSQLVAAIGLLREVETSSVTVFESLLSYVCPPKTRSKPLLSRLIQSKRVSSEADEEDKTYSLEKIEASLSNFNKQKAGRSNNASQVMNAQKGLESVESTMKELEEGLECVFRRLIKNRVTLLNILNH